MKDQDKQTLGFVIEDEKNENHEDAMDEGSVKQPQALDVKEDRKKNEKEVREVKNVGRSHMAKHENIVGVTSTNESGRKAFLEASLTCH